LVNKLNLKRIFLEVRRQYWRHFLGFWWRFLLLLIPLALVSLIFGALVLMFHLYYGYLYTHSVLVFITFMSINFEMAIYQFLLSFIIYYPIKKPLMKKVKWEERLSKKIWIGLGLNFIYYFIIPLIFCVIYYSFGIGFTLPFIMGLFGIGLLSMPLNLKYIKNPIDAWLLAFKGLRANFFKLCFLAAIGMMVFLFGAWRVLRMRTWFGFELLEGYWGLLVLFFGMPFCFFLIGNAFIEVFQQENEQLMEADYE